MIRYRPFRNDDPPVIAELWCSQPPQRALVQPMSSALFDQYVLSKPYFDRHGLIVAENDERILGFVHAGFGPNADGSSLDHSTGVTSMLFTAPHENQAEIAAELLTRSEAYLTARGAKTLYAGSLATFEQSAESGQQRGLRPSDPFYLGLYGGSRTAGVLQSDQALVDFYVQAGYEEVGCQIVLHRSLAGFRPAVNRRQMGLRRKYRIEPTFDPPTTCWWEACTMAMTARTRHSLVLQATGEQCGEVTFWDMEPLASAWSVHAIGLVDLEINDSARREGLATFLVGEVLRQMQGNGVSLAEVQVREDNEPALGLFRNLGFEEIDRGVILRKRLAVSD